MIWLDPVGQRRRHHAVTTSETVPVVDPQVAVERDAAVPMVADAPTAVPLYTITEALDDVAASPLEFIGTGAWFGNASIHACAYRNTRVIVVNE